LTIRRKILRLFLGGEGGGYGPQEKEKEKEPEFLCAAMKKPLPALPMVRNLGRMKGEDGKGVFENGRRKLFKERARGLGKGFGLLAVLPKRW